MHYNNDVIVVDNTNLWTEDYEWYIHAAQPNWYNVEIVEFRVDTPAEATFVVSRSQHIQDVQAYGSMESRVYSESRRHRHCSSRYAA